MGYAAIKVPSHVENADAYVKAAQLNIRINAAKTRHAAWLAEHSDGQSLNDWLHGCGEFSDLMVTANPDDQEAYESAVASTSNGFEIAGIHEDYDVRSVTHPLREGMFSGNFGGVLLDISNALLNDGNLTQKQTDVVRKSLARARDRLALREQKAERQRARDAKSEYVGTVGERREFVLTIKKVLTFPNAFGGTTFFNIMTDSDDNAIIGKGTKRYGYEGATITVAATIVSHKEREGVKQTFINRPKKKVD